MRESVHTATIGSPVSNIVTEPVSIEIIQTEFRNNYRRYRSY